MTIDNSQLAAARDLVSHIGGALDLDMSVRLWDGTLVPLGPNVSSNLAISINNAGVVSSLLRRPVLDRLIRHYALGHIDFEGGTLIDIGEQLAFKRTRGRLKTLDKSRIFRDLKPFLFASALPVRRSRSFDGDEEGARGTNRNEQDYLQFHYDVGNDFYALFLDPEMIYTCGYFTDWNNSLAQAQTDKLDMICRKLRLKPGDSLLDVGCGWGGLICHAARNFGAKAHGVTLSQEQFDYAQAKIERLGLSGQVSIALCDYRDLVGPYDKISSIGMYEHVGVAGLPAYFSKIRSLLAADGLFLNHGITRRGKKKKRKFSSRSEQRALQKYIFPGGELDHIGHSIELMEQTGFEIHDVEGWREHYARTTRFWCENLTANRDQAVALVGTEAYRIWVAYLAGVSLAFTRGTARIYQTLASKSARGPSPLPPTRKDLYR